MFKVTLQKWLPRRESGLRVPGHTKSPGVYLAPAQNVVSLRRDAPSVCGVHLLLFSQAKPSRAAKVRRMLVPRGGTPCLPPSPLRECRSVDTRSSCVLVSLSGCVLRSAFVSFYRRVAFRRVHASLPFSRLPGAGHEGRSRLCRLLSASVAELQRGSCLLSWSPGSVSH